jgi:rhomboid protease GluP
MTSPSFEPAIRVPMTSEFSDSSRIKIYHPKASKQWRLGALAIGLGLTGLLPLVSVFNGRPGGSMADDQRFAAVFGLVFVAIGILLIVNALRGLPRLTVTPEGIKLDSSLGGKWASWNSLDPFEVRTSPARVKKPARIGAARITGPNASKAQLRQKSFSLPDAFLTPIGTIVDELNAERAAAVGTFESSLAPELPVGLAEFKLPWLTFALLAVLIAVFAVEVVFSVTPGAALSPSVETLLALGALSRIEVLSNGEWYRIFTAPLLHGGIVHLLGNSVALLLGGRLLERLVGRLWFFAFFVVGALGGSLMSLAVGPANLVSVGASGALMGMFAALFVGGFRLPAGTQARHRLQANSIQVLIPSLLPLFSTTAIGRIDYGAHFGGAISGAVLATLLLKIWPQTQRIPQLRTVAAGISIVGAVLFVVSAGIAVGNYSKYDVALIPQEEMPKTPADRQARAAALTERYPGDPRSHLYLGEAAAASGDNAGAEREWRIALADAQRLSAMFGSQLEFVIRTVLALLLADQDRQGEARDIANPVCSAPVENRSIDNLLKLLGDKHLCDS